MDRRDIYFLAAVIRTETLGPRELAVALQRLRGPERIFSAPAMALVAAGISPTHAAKFCIARRKTNPDREAALLEKNDIVAISLDDERYPPLLRETATPPQLLFMRGDTNALAHAFPLAFVGTRRVTRYGEQVVRM